jgi:Ca2+-binding RTX toxin-like protein
LAFVVPTANSTTQQLLGTHDTFYLGAGPRITNALSAITNTTATSNNISIEIDGAVSSAATCGGTILLIGTSTGASSGFSFSSVSIGQTSSVSNMVSSGIAIIGSNGIVSNAGMVSAQVFAVGLFGDKAIVTTNGFAHSFFNNALDIDGDLGLIINNGILTAGRTSASISGNGGRIINTGEVTGGGASGNAPGAGLEIFGNDGRVTNSGLVTATTAGIVMRGANNTITNTVSGQVTSDASGAAGNISISAITMEVDGNATLRNAGIVDGNAAGIIIRADSAVAGTVARITNSGSITGGVEGINLTIETVEITNTGTISGGAFGIVGSSGGIQMTIVNDGMIRTTTTGTGVAITGNSGVDTLRNTGTVVGNILLDVGNDRITNDGLIRGNVDMGGGNDAYAGAAGRLVGTVLGGAGLDTLVGGTAADALNGGADADLLIGGAGDDILSGAAGADRISGGLGNDRITAGAGRDVLAGGLGADVFVFTSKATLGIGVARDQITDFVHLVDDFEMIFMNAFIGNAAFTAAGQVRYVQATGLLTGSTDGDASAEWALLLVNKPVITAADFVF